MEDNGTDVKDGGVRVSSDETSAGINSLADDIAMWANDKGFWESLDDAKWLEEVLGPELVNLSDELYGVASRVRTLVLASKIALMHSELSEALETLRNTGADNLDPNFVEELADAAIRIFDTAGRIKREAIGDTIMEKMVVNSERPHKHGRVF